MSYGSDVSEGLPYELSNSVGATYNNTGEMYDIAIAGMPFFLAVSDETPYRRVTAQYRKDQLDTTREPGEQSLIGWWLRSQSSFHTGAGVKFFEPAMDDTVRYRFFDSRGVDVWTQGQVTFLHDTYEVATFDSAPQIVGCKFEGDALLVANSSYLELTYADGGTGIAYDDPDDASTIHSLTTDGTRYFYLNNGHIVRGNISSSSAGDNIYDLTATDGKIRFVKQRLIAGIGRSLYELNPNATTGSALPTDIYTQPSPDWKWTAVAEGPAAIYVAGSNGISSSIYKITLDTANANSLGFPELNVPTVVADFPIGELVRDVDVYLGAYMVIVTNKGIRVGTVSDNGDIAYGPLIVLNNDCTCVAFRDRFAYVSTQVDGQPGLIRVDLSSPTSTSSYLFSYAYDLTASGAEGGATCVAFYGESDKAAFTTTSALWAESDTNYVTTGWLRTGFIRYNMLDEKIFKYVYPRVDTTHGGVIVKSVDPRNEEYALATFPQGSQIAEVSVTFPQGPQQYLAFKFELTGGSDVTKSPVFTGYQVKSLPAIPRQRMIQFPVFCYDREADSLNNQVGYEGYAVTRLWALETVEGSGDTIKIQDFRTGESFVGLIEELDFINRTPTDKRFTGFGGIVLITVRKVS